MADLDTRSKRASSVNFWKPYILALVLPDGAISQGDRQHSVWDYSGILATGAIAPTVIIPTERLYNVPFEDRTLEIPFEDRTLQVEREL